MISKNVKVIRTYISGQRTYNHVKEVSNFHRIQASPGYRQAADYCLKSLKNENIQCEIESYSTKGEPKYFEQILFSEWMCEDAYLNLVSPESIMLCDFKSDNISLMARSMHADYRNQELDIVRLEPGSNAESCKDVDLKGKLIFISENCNLYLDWAILDKGAVGIISDSITEVKNYRERYDLYDQRTYTSLNYDNDNEKKYKTFGFMISPRIGDRLKNLCITAEAEYQKDNSKPRYPKATCYVNSSFYDGTLDNVIASIPGETDEEIIITAHLCHPRSSANDNASGVAGSMEVMKTLNDLINKGELKKPKRTIKLVLIPEMTGTNAYLAAREKDLSKMKAAINLDMIGARQGADAGPVGLYKVPDAGASFVSELAELLLEYVEKDIQALFLPDEYQSLYYYKMFKYCGGSDHEIFSDPPIGIPSIGMTQWPDMYYHTNRDTVDRIDPELLQRSCTICASYVYTLASLSIDDIPYIINKSHETYMSDLTRCIKESMENETGAVAVYKRLEYIKNTAMRAFRDYRRFFSGDELSWVNKIIDNETAFFDNLLEEVFDRYLQITGQDKPEISNTAYDEKYYIIPKRLFKGKLFDKKLTKFIKDKIDEKYSAYRELNKKYSQMNEYIVYWMDGRRTIWEISENVKQECRLDNMEYVYLFISILRDIKLVEFV